MTTYLRGQILEPPENRFRISLAEWNSLPVIRPGGLAPVGFSKGLNGNRAYAVFVPPSNVLRAFVVTPVIRVPCQSVRA